MKIDINLNKKSKNFKQIRIIIQELIVAISQLCRLTAAAARASKICRARAGVSASDVNLARAPLGA